MAPAVIEHYADVIRPLAGLDFRLGSKADLSVGLLNVRFRLGSRH